MSKENKSATSNAIGLRVARWKRAGGVKKVWVRRKEWVVKPVDADMKDRIPKRDIIFAEKLASKLNREGK